MRCVETDVRSETPTAPTRTARVVTDRDEDGSLRVSATTPVQGGQVTFVALPERFPDRAVVRVFALGSVAPSAASECRAHLWVDGAPVTEHEAAIEHVPGGVLYSMLTDLDALTQMGAATRVAARVCERDVTFPSVAQRLARDVAIRAREEASAAR